ncbi:MAG TPA: BACON domain-containing protein, partial [Vicinamibacterales bacterium]|nr:BACON domain-containing protein [Vicinamibacterales bacterium]
MRRYLPLGLLLAVLAHLSGCGESPNRPSVVAETPVNPPKTRARFIQVPWDISLFFNIPGGAVVAGATTAATSGGAAEGDNLTGTFVNSTGFAGTLTGVLTGNLENGTFNGSLSTITRSGCTAERRFSGPITTTALNWSPGAHINDCGGTSPLTSGIQAAAAPSTAPPPCTYQASATGTSVPSAGGAGTVSVTAGEGCTWFATSSADFVKLSVSEGTAAGSVQFTVAANTATTQRTAILVVAGQSFTITQAPAPAPVCTYRLNGGERTFDANGALGGVDMRVAAGCGWQ